MKSIRFTGLVAISLICLGWMTCCAPPPPATAMPTELPLQPPITPLPVEPGPTTGGPLFTLIKEVDVTPVGNLTGGGFTRIGYVTGKDRLVVAFKAIVGSLETDCTGRSAQGYVEYTLDMQETGEVGIITCTSGPDVGGLLLGNEYYFAAMGHDNETNKDGWWLGKFNAVTWESIVEPFFYPLEPEERNGDPMIAMVMGQIDVSGKYKQMDDIGPGHATHHEFFTPDLQFISKRVLRDTEHIDLTSLLEVGGVINFITSTDLWGNMILLQYNTGWNYLGSKTLVENASAPEGMAFDGRRFYVSYVDNSLSGMEKLGLNDNIRLAAFDLDWNLLEDIAVTNFVPDDKQGPGRPTLTLYNNRLYVCYDQTDNSAGTTFESFEDLDIDVHVKIYEVRKEP
jgi:hypothetical protein